MKKAKPRRPAAAYVRVSSASQNGTMQRGAIRQAAEARGDSILTAQWYEETRSGGKVTAARPVLDQLRLDARQGKIGRLYVWKLDRLTRRGIRDTLDLVDEFERHGVELVTLADNFDLPSLLSSPVREPMLALLAWCAQIEWLAITERRAAARENVLARGGTWGRPRRMEEDLVTRATALARAGKSIRQISAQLKTPRATIARAVARCLKSTPSSRTAKTPKKGTSRRAVPPPSQ